MSEHVFDLSGEKNTLVVAKAGKIASVSGTVLIQNDKGETVALQAGQSLNPGDHIILVSGTFTMQLENGEQLIVGKQAVFGDEQGTDTSSSDVIADQENSQQKSAEPNTSHTDQNETAKEDTLPLHTSTMTPPFVVEVDRQEVTPDSGIGYNVRQHNGEYGVFTEGGDGIWAYQLSADEGILPGLSTDQLVHEHFPTLSGGSFGMAINWNPSGAISSHGLTGTGNLSGQGRQGPVDTHADAKDDTASVIEDRPGTVGGNVLTNDEHGAVVSSAAHQGGQYGAITIHPDGSYSYSLDQRAQSLNAGQHVQEHFQYQITDPSGNVATATLTVAVTGTNDIPVISGIDTATATSVGTGPQLLHAPGHLDITDVDTGEAHFKDEIIKGQYGSFLTMKSNGDWEYSVDRYNPDVIKTPQGGQLTESFTVHSADGTAHTITATIVGSNTPAIITGTSRGLTTEDLVNDANGQLHVLDPDTGQSHFAAATQQGTYGQLQIDAKGAWHYHLDNSNPQTQALRASETVHDLFFIKSADGTPHAISIDVFGTNDKAQIGGLATQAGVDEASVKEDTGLMAGMLQATGHLNISDVDAGEAIFPATTYTGTYGQLHISNDGTWGYLAKNADSRIQELSEGEKIQDKITVTSKDGTTHEIIVNIEGTNDAPKLGVITAQHATEDGAAVTGQLTSSDTDHHHQATYSVANAPAGFSLNPDGSYSFDPTHPAYQHLTLGQMQTLTIPLTVTDGEGGSDTKDLKITITGTNDAAQITGLDVGVVSDNANAPQTLLAGGKLDVTDIDTGEDHFQAQLLAGKYGSTLVMSPDGTWQYSVDRYNHDVQALKHGQSLSETFTVKSADGTTHTITTHIEGDNIASVISGKDAGLIKEDTTPDTITGHLNIMDLDAGDAHFQAQTQPGKFGEFAIDDKGEWHYKLDNSNPATQGLHAGETVQETFMVSGVDGTPHPVTIHVLGSADAAVITGSHTASLTEDNAPILQASGQLHVTDLDHGEALFPQQDVTGKYGNLHISNDGKWGYLALNSQDAIQHLGATESLTETLTVHSADGTSQNITVTIHGTNDVPHLSVTQATSTTGTLGVTDTDTTDTHSFNIVNGVGHFGTLTVDPVTGAISYVQNPNVGGMNYNPTTKVYTGQEIFEVKVADNHGGEESKFVTFNATATVSGPAIPGGQPTITTGTTMGTVSPTLGQVQTVTHVAPVNAVTIDLDAHSDTGSSNTDNLTKDTTPTVTGHTDIPFSKVEILDGTKVVATTTSDASGDYNVTTSALGDATHGLTAQATAPSATSHVTSPDLDVIVDTSINATDDTATTDEDSKTAVTGSVLSNDDHANGETAAASSALKTAHGVYTLNADGSYTFTVDNAASQSLAPGHSATDTLTYTITDKAGNTTTAALTTTITGTNDAAQITSSVVDVTEDTNQSATIHLGITDADQGEAHFSAGSLHSAYGSATLAPDGTLVYTLDNNAAQHLNVGEVVTNTLTVISADGTTHDVSVTIHGTNDLPVIGAIAAQSVTEDGKAITGKIITTDVDTGDHSTFSTPGAPAGFILNTDGTYSFDPSNAAYQHLAVGETQVLNIAISATDSHGGIPPASGLTITVTGTNDIPIVSAPIVLPAGTEDITQTITSAQLLANSTDADTTDILSVTHVNVNHGTVTIDSSGTVHFTPEPNYNGKVSFTYDVTDSHGGVVHTSASTDLAAVGDAAIIGGVDTGSATEDTNVSMAQGEIGVGGQLSITDPDAGEAKFDSNPHGGQFGYTSPLGGHLILTPDGSWSYTVSNANPKIQALAVGESLTDTVTVKSADGTTHDIVVTINGTNDVPTIDASSKVTASLDESNSLASVSATSGHLVIDDTDSSDTHTSSLDPSHAPKYGTASLINDTWIYKLDSTNQAVDSLNNGDHISDTFTVLVDDGHGGHISKEIAVEINGTNDAPTVATALTTQTAETGNDISYTVPAGTFTDVDTGDTLTYSATLKDGSALPSWLHFDVSTQTFSGTPPTGSAGTVETRVIATDSQNASAHSDFDINVTAFSGNTGSVSEDGLTTTLSGLVHSVDTFNDATTKGTYGELEMRVDGRWIYKLDNAAANVQGLKGGEVVHDIIAITAKDGTVQHIDVTITGTHDLPTLTLPNAGADVISAVEQHNVDASMDMSHFSPQQHGVAVGHKIMHMYAPGSDVDMLANIAVGDKPTTTRAYTTYGSGGFSYLQDMWFSKHISSSGMDFTAQSQSVRNAMDGGVYVFDDGTVALAQKACDGTPSSLKSYIYYQVIDHLNVNDGFSLIRGQAAAGSHVEIFDGSTSLGTATANAHGEFTLSIFSRQSDGTHSYHTVINGVSSPAQEFEVAGDQVDSVAGGVDAGSVTEDGTIDHISGNLHLADVDVNDHPVIAVQSDTAGAYGKFSIDAQGNWHYELDNSKTATNILHSGQTVTESFHIITTTDSGERVDTLFSIDVHGHDDAPTVGATAQKTLAEGDITFSSFIAGHDNSGHADSTLVYTTHSTVAGFTLNADGTYSIDPKNPAYDHLAVGEHTSFSVPVTVTDTMGAHSVTNIDVIITGTNDAPVVSSTTANLGATLEDTDHTFTQAELLHLVGASDVDGDNLSVSGIHIDAKYGTFTQSGTSWVFHPATNVGAENIAITMNITDGHQGTAISNGVIDITAVTDGVTPIISMSSVPVVTHTAAIVGHIENTFSMAVSAAVTTTGIFFHDHPGSTFLTLASASPNFDWNNLLSITVGGTKIELGSDSNMLAMAITPTSTSYGDVLQIGHLMALDPATLQKVIADLTSGTTVTFEYNPAMNVQNPHIGFRLTTEDSGGPSGLYEYTLEHRDSSGQSGYSIQDIDSNRMRGGVAAHDTTTQAAAPVPLEDGDIPLHVTLTHLDTDGSEQISKIIMSGLPAGSTLSAGTKNADGTFTLSEADLASLKMTPPKDFSGSVVVHLEVTTTDSTDGHVVDTKVDSTDFHLTVLGVAEIPTLATTDVTVNEDSGPIALGIQLSVHVDPSEVQEVKITGVPSGATLSAGVKQADGSWLLSSADTHALKIIMPANFVHGAQLQITATDTDGADVASASKSLVVHINPLLDMTVTAPTDVTGHATQPIDLHVLIGNRVDAGETIEHIRVVLPTGWGIEGLVGTVTHTTAHSDLLFNMTPDQLIHAKIIPPAGFTGTQDISLIEEVREKGVTFNIDTPISIHVTNSAPVVAAPVTDSVAEDADAHHTLDLLSGATDVDGNALSVSGVANLPAGVTLAADGHTLIVDTTDASFQHLAVGDHQDIVVQYQISDAHGGSVTQSATVSVTGTNDLPIIGAIVPPAPVVDPTMQVTSGDSLAKLLLTFASHPGPTFSLGAALVHAFNIPHPILSATLPISSDLTAEALSKYVDSEAIILLRGPSGTLDVQYAAHTAVGIQELINWENKGSGYSVQFLSQKGDNPGTVLINSPSDHSLISQHPLAFSHVNHWDAASNLHFYFTHNGSHPSVESALTYLSGHTGDTMHEGDYTPSGLHVDPDVVSGHVQEDVTLTTSGVVHARDIDDNDVLTFSAKPNEHGTYGDFSVDANGQWHYTLHANSPATQALAAGETEIETFHVLVTDQAGGVSEQAIDVTLTGTNDLPTVSAPSDVSIHAGSDYHFSSSDFSFADVDKGDTLHHVTITNLPPASEGFFYLHGFKVTAGTTILETEISSNVANFGLKFVPASGFSGEVHFDYKVNDSHGDSAVAHGQIHIDNDAPIVASALTASLTEDDGLHHSIDLLSGATDADGDTLSVTGVNNLPAGVTLAADGHTLVIDSTGPSFQHLAAGEHQNIVVNYQVTDGSGSVNQSATITVTGTNDIPTLTVTPSSVAQEGHLDGHDADTGDTLTYSISNANGNFGTLSIDPTTHVYTYNQAHSVAGMSLANGVYSGQDTFEVKVSDGHGGEVSKFITFDATATVGAPTAGNPNVAVITPATTAPTITNTAPVASAAVTPPVNAVTLDLDSTSDTGTSNTDNLTSDKTPTITGHTDIPFSQVQIVEGTRVVGQTVSDAHGDYSVTTSPLVDATHNLLAAAIAPSAVQEVLSSHLDVVIDTGVLSPTIHFESTGSDNIYNAAEVASGAAGTISATVALPIDTKAGDILTINGTAQTLSATDITAKGVTIEVAPGDAVTATITDAAGNTSAPVSETAAISDLTADAGTVTVHNITSDNILNDDEITKTHVEVSGTATGGDISDGDKVSFVLLGKTYEGTVGANGDWSISNVPAAFLAIGSKTISVEVESTDTAGNTVTTTASHTVIVDRTIDTPTSDLTDATDTGFSQTDNITKTHSPVIIGHAEAGSIVVITDASGTQVGTATANAQGQYSVTTSSLSEGDHTLTITSTDVAGNSATVDQAVHVDTTAPTFTMVQVDYINTPINHISGIVDSDAHSVDVVITDIATRAVIETLHAVLDGNGGWSVDTSSLPDGGYNATPTVVDAAGNVSTHGMHDFFKVDTQVQALTLSLTNDTGTSTSDNITTDGQLSIGNKESTTAVIEYSTDGTTWTHSFTPVDGAQTVYVRQTDLAGNISAPTSLTFTLDNSAPAPTVELLHDTGPYHTHDQQLLTDKTTSNAQLNVTHETGASVEYSVDGGHTWSGSFNPTADGQIGVDVRQTDTAGNVSPVTHFDFTYDTTKPVFTVQNTPDSNNPVYTLSGHAGESLTDIRVDITVAGGRSAEQTLHPTIDANGDWHITTHSLPDGDYQVDVAGTDLAGNSSHIGHGTMLGHFTIDSTAHAADDTASINEDDTTAVTGNVLTNDEQGSTVTTTGDIAGKYGTYHLSADGSYTYTLDNSKPEVQAFADGSHHDDPISYSIQDAAGNTATATLTTTVTGTNDAPTITVQSMVSGPVFIDEDSLTHKQAFVFKTSDVDTGDTDTISVDANHTPKFGHLVDKGAFWIYQLDNTNSQVNVLNDGDTLSETFRMMVTDASGATSYKEIAIVINGHTDVVHDEVTTTEESSVTLQLLDPNISTTQHYVDQTMNGKFGSLHLQTDGTWTYTPGARAQHLAQGQDSYDKFAITSPDGNHHAIKVTVQGVNDAPTVGHALSAQSIDEGNSLHLTIPSDTFQDVDTSDTLTYTATKTDGSALPSWLHFNPATQTFSGTAGHGDDGIIGVKVTATDGSNAQVSSNFNLSVIDNNQAPVITTVTHDHDHSSGQIHVTDTDTLQYTVNHQGVHQYGTLHVQPDGSFQYSLDSHVNTAGMQVYGGKGGWHHKGGSRTGQDLFEVQVSDGKGGTVTKFLSFAVHTDYNGHHPKVTGASDSDSMLQTRVANDDSQHATIMEDVVIDSLRITSGNMVAAVEAATALVVTGSVRGVFNDGDMVTLHVNGKEFTGDVHKGDFSIDIPAADLAADTNLQATISTTSSTGELLTALQGMEYHVDADGLVVPVDVVDTPDQIDDLPAAKADDTSAVDESEHAQHASFSEVVQPLATVAEVEEPKEAKHVAVEHETESTDTQGPTTAGHDLTDLLAPEEDPLNLDAATDSGADTGTKTESTDAANADSTDERAGDTVDTGSAATIEDSKAPEHNEDAVKSHDVLDSHEDHKVDDLLASQPEKAPVAAPVSDTAGAGTDAHHDSAPVADTSTLDSNLVDTPEDQ